MTQIIGFENILVLFKIIKHVLDFFLFREIQRENKQAKLTHNLLAWII